ncbi:MAG: DUF2061 domain-containing protein [Pseudomonadota bacterium]
MSVGMGDDMSNDKQTKTYALKKALGFSAVHFVVGTGLAFILTGQWVVALGVALIEPIVNAGIIYGHSRWELRRDQNVGNGRGLVSGGAF